MREVKVAPIMAFFSKLEDPRSETNKLHPLETVIAITILAVMSFAKGWEAIEEYAEAKKDWLAKFLDMPNGVPSHDVYRRVFNALKSEAVSEQVLFPFVLPADAGFKSKVKRNAL